MCCLVVPVGEAEEYQVYCPTAAVIYTQHTVAAVLGVTYNRVQVHTKRVGCSYGGKLVRHLPLVAGAALAAKLTARPVRCNLDRQEYELIFINTAVLS